jgi:hypothetical protein
MRLVIEVEVIGVHTFPEGAALALTGPLPLQAAAKSVSVLGQAKDPRGTNAGSAPPAYAKASRGAKAAADSGVRS